MTTQIVDDRAAALKVGFYATDWPTPISFEDYLAHMSDWDVKAIVRDGECIGASYRRDNEIHVSIMPKWRGLWMTRGLLRELFSGTSVTTRVTPGHDYMFDILSRLGFKPTNTDVFVRENGNGHCRSNFR